MQKAIVGLLVLTVMGAITIGVYDTTRPEKAVGAPELLALEIDDTITNEKNDVSATPTPEAVVTELLPLAEPGQPVQQQQSQNTVGDSWQGSGVITALDDNGMMLETAETGEIYVELGPPTYWQTQAVTLTVGENVSVTGFFNGEQYHSAVVTKADGTQLALRTTEGQPLWTGGANSHTEQGQQNANGQSLVSPEEWITLEGTVTVVNGSSLTVQTLDEGTLALQLGQKNFIDTQAIQFAVGDEISVVGFWQGAQFKAGEITQLATGERLMLLDPNGRPLWGGPGRSSEQGQSGGNGQGANGGGQQGQGNNNNQGQGANGGSQQGNSNNQGQGANGGGQQGKGNGYQGGRNQDQTE